MPILATNSLKEKVQNLPALMRVALEGQAKAQIVIARLEAQIAKLKAQASAEVDSDENNTDLIDDILEDDLALIKLETRQERLKLELTEAEDKVELEFRSSEGKVTESHVRAALGNNPTVIRLRHEIVDTKEEARIRKVTLQRERQLTRIAGQEQRFEARFVAPLVNEKLVNLQEKLEEANAELILADVEVEVARTTLETYKMLVKTEG